MFIENTRREARKGIVFSIEKQTCFRTASLGFLYFKITKPTEISLLV